MNTSPLDNDKNSLNLRRRKYRARRLTSTRSMKKRKYEDSIYIYIISNSDKYKVNTLNTHQQITNRLQDHMGFNFEAWLFFFCFWFHTGQILRSHHNDFHCHHMYKATFGSLHILEGINAPSEFSLSVHKMEPP